MKKFFTALCFLLFSALLTVASAAKVIYVDSTASNGGDGASWETAFNDLQTALTTYSAGDTIWVAQGSYKPSGPGGDPSAWFLIFQKNVVLLGGFSGEGAIRNPDLYPTVLSGAPVAGIDDTFLQKVVRHIEAHLSDEEYGMPQLCKAMNMSRSNLFRKLKALTGKSATDLTRGIRLEKAKELLETTEMSVSEVCYAVGFNNTSYFSTAFREAYGVAPSEVRRK